MASSSNFIFESPSSSPGPAINPSLQESPSSTQATATPGVVTFHPDPQAALFIDSLAQRFHLTMQQTSDLHGLYQLAMSLPGGLGRADVMTRIYALACHYGSEQRLIYAVQVSEGLQSGVGDLRGLFQELSIRLKDTFQLTREQKLTIRRLSQDFIYKSSRTAFKVLYLDVEKKLRAKPELHGMDNIFGQLARESKLTSEAKRIASNVRNTFRQDIRDGIIGKKRSSVEQFTIDCCVRYRQGIKSGQFEQGYLVHNVLLRRVAWENKAVLGVDEDSTSEDENSENAHSDGNSPPKKRKRTAAKGRVGDGEDFWSKVDKWFKEKIELWGSDFKGEEWKRFIDESLTLDNERHTGSEAKKLRSSPVNNFTAASTSALPPPPQAQAQIFPSAGLSFTDGSSQVQTTSFDFMAAFK
ncbi:hypothetical protein M413DRAFT_30013 [Hebeloma cylindrosporum]|uniref:Uncharacterized protein n=1 Tax=Hebeloma cylindrosporum TaxID=76867 RepID=A0A0C3C4C9_HEBCY|nr:hypothetical protein M413DRAFT_30013 [Hebeloma cylindrosporum h7]